MGVSAVALGGSDERRNEAYIFVTVMVATGLMSPESQKASNSPHGPAR